MADKISSLIEEKIYSDFDKLNKALDANQAAFIKAYDAADKYNGVVSRSATLKDFTDNQVKAAGAISQTEKQLEKTRLADIKLQQQREQSIDKYNRGLAKQEAAQAKANARAAEAARPYNQLASALSAAEKKALDIGVAFGKNSTEFSKATLDVNRLRAQVDGIEQPLGKFQRNVGNYAGGIQKVLGNAFNGIRTIANILPGLGLSGAFLLIFEGIQAVVQEFGLFTGKLTDAQKANETLVKSIAGTEYQKAISNVADLRANIDLAKKGFLDKDAVLKQYNETIGKTTGQVSSLDAAEAALNKNADAYIKFTFLKAVANSALQKSAELAAQAAADALKDPVANVGIKDVAKTFVDADKTAKTFTDKLSGYYSTFLNIVTGAGSIRAGQDYLGTKKLAGEQAAIRLQDSSKTLTKESNLQKKIFDDYNKQAAELAKQFKFDFYQDGEDKGAASKVQQDRLKAINSLIEAEKIRNQIVQENDKSTYNDRIESANTFESEIKKLVNRRREIELNAEKLTADGIKAINKNNDNDISRSALDANNQREKVAKEQLDKAKKEQDAINKFLTGGERESIRRTEEASTARLAVIEQERADYIAKLNERYKDGSLSTKQYNEEILKIDTATSQKRLELQLQTVQALIKIQEDGLKIGIGNPADLQKNKEQVVAIQKQITDLGIKTTTAGAKTEAEKLKELHDLELQLGNESLQAARSIAAGIFQARLDSLNKQKDAINEQADYEKEQVNRGIGTSREKARKQAIIDEEAANKQKILDGEIAKEKRKAAIADRIGALAAIAINTAVAATKVTAQGGIFGLGLIPLVIGIGAIQAAAVLAQPLPAFKDGGTHKGGRLLWGEAGTELAVTPGGRAMLSPNSATIDSMPAGTRIFNNSETMRMMAKPDHVVRVGGRDIDLTQVVGAVRETTAAVKGLVTGGKQRGVVRSGLSNSYLKRNGL